MKTKAKVKITSAHVAALKLPMSQNIIKETCSSAIYLMKLMPADKIAETIIPDKMRLFDEIPPLPEDKYITKNRVKTAHIKANRETENTVPVIMVKRIARDAPKAAPVDTPSVYGSAKGFKSIAWNTTPETASPPPTIAAVKILGSLTSITTTVLILFISVCVNNLLNIRLKTSRNGILIYPIPVETPIIRGSEKIRRKISTHCKFL